MTDQEHVTPDDIATATDGEVSAYTVRRLCRDGRFPRARKMGRSWVIPAADAVVFLREFDRYRSGAAQYVAESPYPPVRGLPPPANQTGGQ